MANMKLLNGKDYYDWRNLIAGWGMPDSYTLYEAKRRRLPLDPETARKRQEHMQTLHSDGAPYSWIAKLYEIDRAQVYRIINGLKNN